MPLPDMIKDSTSHLLRIIHYPPLNGTEQMGAIRGGAHEDINLITLLVAGTEPGLQVKDLDGNWHNVSCDQGSLAINSGDMLHEISGKYFPSTTHRVINPMIRLKIKVVILCHYFYIQKMRLCYQAGIRRDNTLMKD